MTEPKVSLDDAVKHFTTTLSHHAESITRIDHTISTIQTDLTSQMNTLQTTTRHDLGVLETNLTDLLSSKDTVWTQVTNDMRSLKDDLQELKSILGNANSHARRYQTHNVPDTVEPFFQDTSTPVPPILQQPSSSAPLSSPHWSYATPRTIVLPPTSAAPTFSGKPIERPRQFLLRIEEYTQTVNHWSRDTLLQGISQYLEEDALEWYCQLRLTTYAPHTWDDFVLRFLAQFHSPIRAAQQDQAWTDCKQGENETINQFVVRLRSLWLEQKTDEKEPDFTKHLFCKMRPDMLNLMNFSRSSSLENIVIEAQKVEEILFLRNKEQRQRDLQQSKQTNTNSYFRASASSARANQSTLPSLLDATFCPPNTSRLYVHSSMAPQPSTPRAAVTCWRCYEPGHYAPDCPLNEDKSLSNSATATNTDAYPPRVTSSRNAPYPQSYPSRSKNE